MVKQSSPSESRLAAENARIEALAHEALARCDALARCSEAPDRLIRTFCSPAMREAHRLVGEWMQAAGMATRVDAAGNLLGMYYPPGCDPRRRVLIGSHLDTVIDAGRYDGALGVLLGIAAVAAMRDLGLSLPWAIETIGFSEEEGVRFGAPFIGSRALAGTADAELLSRTDANGVSVTQALRDFGLQPAEIGQCRLEPGSVVAFIEPHIEQGPVLDEAGEALAIVSAIAGQTRLTVTWTGGGGHAGTAPMAGRRDALPAAARWTAVVEETGRATPGLVATVGRVEVDPNATNCIPRVVRTSLDVRHAGDQVRRRAVDALVARAEEFARSSHLKLSIEYVHEHAAMPMDIALTNRLAAAVESAAGPPRRLVSGAGHDAGVIAAAAPTAMMFIRSPGGVSHDPREAALLDDVAAALNALVRCVESLGGLERQSLP